MGFGSHQALFECDREATPDPRTNAVLAIVWRLAEDDGPWSALVPLSMHDDCFPPSAKVPRPSVRAGVARPKIAGCASQVGPFSGPPWRHREAGVGGSVPLHV